jgi:hypothetical protein
MFGTKVLRDGHAVLCLSGLRGMENGRVDGDADRSRDIQ